VGDELSWMWGANREKKLAEVEGEVESVEVEVDDPTTTVTERTKLRNLKRPLAPRIELRSRQRP
jgi:hypothetical protein